jgi:hypothetical protein
MARGYSRDDVQTRSGTPCVNVKVYGDVSDGFKLAAKYAPADGGFDAGFTEDWIREHLSEETLDQWFWDTCSFEFEYLQDLAAEVLGIRERDVTQEGRSGGWAVVSGLPELEDWDAVQLAKWRKFEKRARSIAADIPYQLVQSIYLNAWEAEQAERVERARAAMQGIATIA